MKPTNEWILVSERLPEDRTMVLAFDCIGEVIKIGYHTSAQDHWGNQWTLEGTYYHTHNYDHITHWQPLPSAPEE